MGHRGVTALAGSWARFLLAPTWVRVVVHTVLVVGLVVVVLAVAVAPVVDGGPSWVPAAFPPVLGAAVGVAYRERRESADPAWRPELRALPPGERAEAVRATVLGPPPDEHRVRATAVAMVSHRLRVQERTVVPAGVGVVVAVVVGLALLRPATPLGATVLLLAVLLGVQTVADRRHTARRRAVLA